MTETFKPGHALIIGVGADLPNTIDDANGLATILRDEGRCAYPSAQVQLLIGSSATRAAILNTLDKLAQSTDQNATVVVYFSGHGYQVSPRQRRLLPAALRLRCQSPEANRHQRCRIHRQTARDPGAKAAGAVGLLSRRRVWETPRRQG
jgi:hypothetical protein